MSMMMVRNSTSVHSLLVHSIDDLRTPISDAEIDITQLGMGRVQGGLTRVTLGDIAFSLGSFSSSVRASGIFSKSHTTVGVLLSGSENSVVWGNESVPGSIMCTPPGEEHDIRYQGRASFAGLSIRPEHLTELFRGNASGEAPSWERKTRYVPHSHRTANVGQYLSELATTISLHEGPLETDTVNFWTRSVVDAFLGETLDSDAIPADPISSGTRLVREVEHYLGSRPRKAVHISEICSTLNVSRRTLHRAFHDVMGMGPLTFLQRKRLSDVHNRLLTAELQPRTAQITQIATEFGFSELGRFAQYYKALFGEHPSQTLRRRK